MVSISPSPRAVRIVKHVVLAVLLCASLYAMAGDVYITQATSGSDTGVDCANAHSASWFNSKATGGNTYHLCGTFTGGANSTMLTVPASGAAGNPLIILFETDAVLTSPAWSPNGAVNINGKNYVTVDGGSNGIIRNTDDGTALGYQIASKGVYATNGASNIEVKNLTISNLYIHESTDLTGAAGSIVIGSSASSSAFNNIQVHDNTMNAAYWGVNIVTNASGGGYHVYNNSISDACHHISISENSGPHTYSDLLIHGNTITDWTSYAVPADFCHTDGIIIFAQSGSTMPVSIYDNYLHGDIQPTTSLNASPTAFVFCTYGGAPPGSLCSIYNNVIVNDGSHNNVLIWLESGRPGNQIFNNTLVGLSTDGGTAIRLQTSTTTATLKNNIITRFKLAIDSYNDPAKQVTSNNNDFDGYTSGGWFYASNFGGSPSFYTLSQWQATGQDASSSTGSAKLDASYKLQSGSAAVGLGTNLTSLGIPTLNSDKAGVGRPATGAWDSGAYQFGSDPPPPPPSGLQATAH
jgi:hypothetical protein